MNLPNLIELSRGCNATAAAESSFGVPNPDLMVEQGPTSRHLCSIVSAALLSAAHALSAAPDRLSKFCDLFEEPGVQPAQAHAA